MKIELIRDWYLRRKKIHGIPLLFNLNNIFAKLYEVSIKFSLNMKIIITMLAVFR